MKSPYFKDLSNEALRDVYWGYRALAYNNAAAVAAGAVNKHKGAFQMGALMKNIGMIEAIAKQRKISLDVNK